MATKCFLEMQSAHDTLIPEQSEIMTICCPCIFEEFTELL